MTDKTNVLIPRANDCILCVKVGKVRRESLYEMTRKYWKVSLDVGKEDVQSEYLGKSVAEIYGRSQNPVKYINM